MVSYELWYHQEPIYNNSSINNAPIDDDDVWFHVMLHKDKKHDILEKVSPYLFTSVAKIWRCIPEEDQGVISESKKVLESLVSNISIIIVRIEMHIVLFLLELDTKGIMVYKGNIWIFDNGLVWHLIPFLYHCRYQGLTCIPAQH